MTPRGLCGVCYGAERVRFGSAAGGQAGAYSVGGIVFVYRIEYVAKHTSLSVKRKLVR